MPYQFSKVEQMKLYTSWLVWKDIRDKEFLKAFRPLWDLAINDVEVLLKQCGYRCRLQDVGKVGLTLQPNVSFAFSVIKKAYFLNVWSFFFCPMKSEASLFFRPPSLLANKILHEYSHYRFWRDHGMLNEDEKIMKQFESEQGLEDEKYALTEEVNFIKKARKKIRGRERRKLFRVQSWTSNGTPNCEGRLAQLETRKNINLMIKQIERAIQDLSSKKSYDNQMTKQATETHATLSSILRLKVTKYEIVEMKI